MIRILVFCLLAAFSLAFLSCGRAARPVSIGDKPVSVNGVSSNDAPAHPRRPVPEMSWTGFDGGVSKLKDFHGKVVILDFWATYCKPCIEEIPHLKKLQEKYGIDNLMVFGLHVGGDEDQPKIPEFVKRLDITYPLAYPEDDLTAYVFGQQTAIPQTAIFDRKGNLVKKITGFDDNIRLELDRIVDEAVSNNG